MANGMRLSWAVSCVQRTEDISSAVCTEPRARDRFGRALSSCALRVGLVDYLHTVTSVQALGRLQHGSTADCWLRCSC